MSWRPLATFLALGVLAAPPPFVARKTVPGDTTCVQMGWAIPDTLIESSRRHYGPAKPGLGADVRVRVTPRISHDEHTGAWTYSFVVDNLRESPRGIFSFSVEPAPSSAVMAKRKGWNAERADSLLNWFCTDPGPQPKVDDGNIHPSPYDIQPGAKGTFTFTCDVPPGDSLNYYVHGFHPLPVAKTDDQIDSILNTPYNFFLDALHGRAMGPKRAR